MDSNLITWHYSYGVPLYLKRQRELLKNLLDFFNFADLIMHLFTPYKRMVASPKTTLTERLSFYFTSIFVGFWVRTILILTGFIAILAFLVFDLLYSLLYSIIPFFSIPSYIKYKNSKVFNLDLNNPAVFYQKLKNNIVFTDLANFFDNSFPNLFEHLPPLTQFGVKVDDDIAQTLLAIFQKWPYIEKYLEVNGIKSKNFELLLQFLKDHYENPPKLKPKPIGQTLAFGYTNTLDQFGADLTLKKLTNTVIRKDTLAQIEKILLRPQNNNILLVGDPGVGRHTVLENLASAIQRELVPGLLGRRIFLLDTVALAGSSQSLIEVRKNFEDVLMEAKNAGNIILAIDHIDRIVTASAQRSDLSEVVVSILADNLLPIIGISTTEDFNKFIRPNTSVNERFERVDIKETTPEETLQVLFGKSLEFAQKESVFTMLNALVEIVEKSNRLISDKFQPEKSILLLIDAIAEAKSQKIGKIHPLLVDQIIAVKTKTPVGKISATEAQKLTDLEQILHIRIVDQDEAISAIARAMRRARAGIEVGTHPIGSFLFLGPTGVGKTETAKALAESYFGSENRMVRIDMSEFNSQDSVKRLIGDVQNETPGHLTTLIRENPYTLLLVDEFEKAAPAVLNLFLQILDEGFLTDGFGKKVSFDNIIIIATSNAGAEYIREILQRSLLGSGESLSVKVLNYVLEKGLFSPELINRFDGVVVYKPLTQNQIVAVTELMLKKLADQIKETKNINLEISSGLAVKIAHLSFDQTLGARPIRRFIADKIEDGIAKMIIDGTLKSGSTIPAATLLKFVS